MQPLIRNFQITIIIRPEQAEDIQSIYDVTAAAFLNAPHSDHTEQYIVAALRESHALTFSFVAEDEGDIVGHVAISPVIISDGSEKWYGLGPISVLPRCQGKGIGSQLMTAAIEGLNSIGANGCVLLGDPSYYQRFGFCACAGLALPGVPAEYFQALLIQGELPQGEVSYHKSCAAKE